jgi:hypothetical protein
MTRTGESTVSKIVYLGPDELRPHPLNRELYGTPTANSAYHDLRADMKRRGFDESQPLLITTDHRVIRGVTRHAVAKSVGLAKVPCEIFAPSAPEVAELEIERELVRGNMYRTKTETMKAREQRKVLEIETVLARRRMGEGTDDGPSKATDRVGKIFGESGKSVQRRLKVLEAIEQADADGDKKRAGRLTELLDGKHITKALDLLAPKDKAPRPVKKVDVPPTLHEHVIKAHSANYEAAAKATCEPEIEVIERNIDRMANDVRTARERLGCPVADAGDPGGEDGEANPSPRQRCSELLGKISEASTEISDPEELADLAGDLRALAKRLENQAKRLENKAGG